MPREIRDAASDLRLLIGHTSDFAAGELLRARRLLEQIFDGDFSFEDWEHALGGTQILAWKAGALIGHAALTPRQLRSGQRELRAGYVEAVGVHPAQQRAGIGGKMMALLEAEIALQHELGALCASDVGAAFYRKRGWQPWQGPLSAMTPSGVVRTEQEDGGVFVWPTATELDFSEPLSADFRGGDVW
jgi:aminoglycoside 2'-N-acetyltransferase I